MSAISPISAVAPYMPSVLPPDPQTLAQHNLVVNQTVNAFVAGSVDNLVIANEVNLGDGAANYDNVTINQTENVYIANAASAYDKAGSLDGVMATWLKQLLNSLVVDHQAPPQDDSKQPVSILA